MDSITMLRRFATGVAGAAAGLTLVVMAVQAGTYDPNPYLTTNPPPPVLDGWPWFLVLIAGAALLVASALHAYPPGRGEQS